MAGLLEWPVSFWLVRFCKFWNIIKHTNRQTYIMTERLKDIGRFHTRGRTIRLDGQIVSDEQIVRCENGTNKFFDEQFVWYLAVWNWRRFFPDDLSVRRFVRPLVWKKAIETDSHVDRETDRQTDFLTNTLTNRLTDWLADWMTDRLTGYHYGFIL